MNCHFKSICESCTFFVTTIEFDPPCNVSARTPAADKGQVARAKIFDGLLDRLDHDASLTSILDADHPNKYIDEHRHTGLGLHTAADIHYGLVEAVRDKRAGVLDAAYAAHPERFVRKPSEPPKLPSATWINRPNQAKEQAQ